MEDLCESRSHSHLMRAQREGLGFFRNLGNLQNPLIMCCFPNRVHLLLHRLRAFVGLSRNFGEIQSAERGLAVSGLACPPQQTKQPTVFQRGPVRWARVGRQQRRQLQKRERERNQKGQTARRASLMTSARAQKNTFCSIRCAHRNGRSDEERRDAKSWLPFGSQEMIHVAALQTCSSYEHARHASVFCCATIRLFRAVRMYVCVYVFMYVCMHIAACCMCYGWAGACVANILKSWSG